MSTPEDDEIDLYARQWADNPLTVKLRKQNKERCLELTQLLITVALKSTDPEVRGAVTELVCQTRTKVMLDEKTPGHDVYVDGAV